MIPKMMFVLLAAVTALLSLSADQGKAFLFNFTINNKDQKTIRKSETMHRAL